MWILNWLPLGASIHRWLNDNLNLPICSSFFFLPCAWLPPPLVHQFFMLAPLLHCTDFFVRFNRSQFYSLFILKHFCPVRKLIWMDKNIFQWRMETGLKDYFIMYSCKGHELWILLTVFVHQCCQPVTIENFLLPTYTDHYALRK